VEFVIYVPAPPPPPYAPVPPPPPPTITYSTVVLADQVGNDAKVPEFVKV
jgi:hypothetical protein